MADYHPLIAKAIAGLEKNTGENRRVLYERARTALVNQLRSVEPALDESEITRERLALEEAIRKVEGDASKRAREEELPDSRAPSLTDQGLRDLRATLAQAEGLGGAAAQANRSAREFYQAVPGESDTAQHYFEPPASEPLPPVSEPEMTDEAPLSRGDERVAGSVHARELPEGALPPPPYEDEAYARPARSWSGVIKLVILIAVIGGLAGAGYWQRHTISALVASFRAKPAKPQQTAAPAGRPKIADRVGDQPGAPKTATAPAAAVAQKVVLYEQGPAGAQPDRYVGSAIWRTETVSPGPGLAPELAVRADVEIPERHVRMTWSLRRNTDKALPASHTIEIQFTLPADFPEGGIGRIPGMWMKQNEQNTGIPLVGLSVKVTNGYFLIGLSAVETDLQRNVELLKQRDWLEVPIDYTSGKRAILALEKGTPGQRAFEEAFRAWSQ